jgi:hypothetical protein
VGDGQRARAGGRRRENLRPERERQVPRLCLSVPATAGASSPRTSLIPNQMRLPSRTGKKLFTKIADVLQDWPTQAPVKVMFQDEARFGRISDVRYCWAPFPVRSLCRAMLTTDITEKSRNCLSRASREPAYKAPCAFPNNPSGFPPEFSGIFRPKAFGN